jgi:2-dehydro-3-deoxygluconokinase
MFKTPSTGSERFVSYYRSGSAAANAKLSELALDSITEAKVLHVSGIYPALSEHCGEIITAVMTVAKSAGVMVSLDINYRPALWDKSRAADTLRSLVPLADIVFGDKQELQMLFENEISESAKLLAAVQELGASDVIMKQGQDGATALVDSAIWQQAIFPVEVIDTVGAGDAFVAGYISGWLDDESIQQRLERAAVCGALACLNLGDREGAPSREELVAAGGGVRG